MTRPFKTHLASLECHPSRRGFTGLCETRPAARGDFLVFIVVNRFNMTG